MMRFRLLCALFLLAGLAGAQEVSTAIVPVVGSVFGPSLIIWRTDVEIANETALPADVAIELPSAPSSPVIFVTLGPGERQRYTDIVSQAFGLETALSPLRVTTGGRRPISVRATAYAVGGAGMSPLQPIEVYYRDTFFPIRVLDGLAFSDEYRTNIGLVNVGEREAEFILALQRIPGRNLAVTTVRVSAGSIVHSSIQSIFPMITAGSGFSVVVETPSRDTHVYASVIESATNAGQFIVPRVGTR